MLIYQHALEKQLASIYSFKSENMVRLFKSPPTIKRAGKLNASTQIQSIMIKSALVHERLLMKLRKPSNAKVELDL